MNRRRLLGWGGVALLMIAAFGTLSYPVWRLGRERAGALAEGLALAPNDLPSSEVLAPLNAASLFVRARQAWRKEGNPWMRGLPILTKNACAISGTLSDKDRAYVQRWCGRLAVSHELWREACQRTQLAFDSQRTNRNSIYSPDLNDDRYAISSLIAAAAVGEKPRENLTAAARLAALLRKEPYLQAAAGGSRLGLDCLTVGKRLGLAKEVASLLGPTLNLRTVLRPELPRMLKLVAEAHRPQEFQKGYWIWPERILHPQGAAEASMIAGWRKIWRSLPNDPRDFETAAKVADANVPLLTRLTGVPMMVGGTLSRFRLGGDGRDVGQALRAIAELEAARKALR